MSYPSSRDRRHRHSFSSTPYLRQSASSSRQQLDNRGSSARTTRTRDRSSQHGQDRYESSRSYIQRVDLSASGSNARFSRRDDSGEGGRKSSSGRARSDGWRQDRDQDGYLRRSFMDSSERMDHDQWEYCDNRRLDRKSDCGGARRREETASKSKGLDSSLSASPASHRSETIVAASHSDATSNDLLARIGEQNQESSLSRASEWSGSTSKKRPRDASRDARRWPDTPDRARDNDESSVLLNYDSPPRQPATPLPAPRPLRPSDSAAAESLLSRVHTSFPSSIDSNFGLNSTAAQEQLRVSHDGSSNVDMLRAQVVESQKRRRLKKESPDGAASTLSNISNSPRSTSTRSRSMDTPAPTLSTSQNSVPPPSQSFNQWPKRTIVISTPQQSPPMPVSSSSQDQPRKHAWLDSPPPSPRRKIEQEEIPRVSHGLQATSADNPATQQLQQLPPSQPLALTDRSTTALISTSVPFGNGHNISSFTSLPSNPVTFTHYPPQSIYPPSHHPQPPLLATSLQRPPPHVSNSSLPFPQHRFSHLPPPHPSLPRRPPTPTGPKAWRELQARLGEPLGRGGGGRVDMKDGYEFESKFKGGVEVNGESRSSDVEHEGRRNVVERRGEGGATVDKSLDKSEKAHWYHDMDKMSMVDVKLPLIDELKKDDEVATEPETCTILEEVTGPSLSLVSYPYQLT